MTLTLETLQAWQDLLGDNELERVLDDMRRTLATTPWASELAQQSGRLRSVRDQVRINTASPKEQQQVEDAVRKALLDLLDILRGKVQNTPEPTGPQPATPPQTVVNKYFNGKYVSETMNFYGKPKRKKS